MAEMKIRVLVAKQNWRSPGTRLLLVHSGCWFEVFMRIGQTPEQIVAAAIQRRR